MDIKENNDFARRFRNGEVTRDELKEYLVRNYSVYDIADELAGFLIEDNEFKRNQIILSPKQEQIIKVVLSKIARPKNVELGRKPKTEKYLSQREEINPELFVK